jgi:hypothetical protein
MIKSCLAFIEVDEKWKTMQLAVVQNWNLFTQNTPQNDTSSESDE